MTSKAPLQFIFTACKPELHTSPSGDIKSPGYPNHYHNSANCVYNITVQDGKRIEIEFTTFDVEDDNGKCVYDQLMIFEGDSMVHPRIFCGRGPGKFISKGNKLFLRFVTDLSVTKQGFFGHYDTIEGGKSIALHHIFLLFCYVILRYALQRRYCSFKMV